MADACIFFFFFFFLTSLQNVLDIITIVVCKVRRIRRRKQARVRDIQTVRELSCYRAISFASWGIMSIALFLQLQFEITIAENMIVICGRNWADIALERCLITWRS